MYSGTKNWGSVRLTIKRSKSIGTKELDFDIDIPLEYIEKHAFALKYKKERLAERRAQLADAKNQPFGLIVKA